MNKELGELDLIKVLKNLCVISAVIEGYDEKGRRVTLYPDKSDMDKIQAALKRDEAKKPLYKQGTRFRWFDRVKIYGRYYNLEKWSNSDACPNCKKDISHNTPYCEHCGQALDWSDEE